MTATGPPTAVDYACGVLQVEAEHYRHQRDTLAATTELLIAAMDGGHWWEIDQAVHSTVLTLNQIKENRRG